MKSSLAALARVLLLLPAGASAAARSSSFRVGITIESDCVAERTADAADVSLSCEGTSVAAKRVAAAGAAWPRPSERVAGGSILRSVAEGGGSETTAWLREIARDAKEHSGLRERAVRSLAESGAATSELISLYDAVPDRVVRERLVTLLSERGDRAARDKLRAIATDDPDEDLRRRAVRKLAESR